MQLPLDMHQCILSTSLRATCISYHFFSFDKFDADIKRQSIGKNSRWFHNSFTELIEILFQRQICPSDRSRKVTQAVSKTLKCCF